MQDAYDNLGIPKFEIIIDCEEADLKDCEIEAFNIFKPTLNLAPAGGEFPISVGETNSQSKYSNKTLMNAIVYVSENLDEPLKSVSKKLNIHYSTLKNICNGHGHKWLALSLPEQYTKVLGNAGKRVYNTASSKGIVYPNIVSPEGLEYCVTNATAFAREHNLNQGTLGQLLHGKVNHHHGWTLVK